MSLPDDLAFLSLCPIDSESDEEEGALYAPVLSSKEERIQRAVEESKRTYGWAQAETKYGWFYSAEITAKKMSEPKHVQRYQESHAQLLYFHRKYEECLMICQTLLAIAGYDNRETIDIALRCTLKLKDVPQGERLARECRSMWLTTPALAYSSGQVFLMAELYNDAFKAFVSAMAVRNIQYPYMVAFTECLERWSTSSAHPPTEREAASRLLNDVRSLSSASTSAAQSFARPLFDGKQSFRTSRLAENASGGESEVEQHVFLTSPEIDQIGKDLDLGARTMGRLQALWIKMIALAALANKGVVPEEEEEELVGVKHI